MTCPDCKGKGGRCYRCDGCGNVCDVCGESTHEPGQDTCDRCKWELDKEDER